MRNVIFFFDMAEIFIHGVSRILTRIYGSALLPNIYSNRFAIRYIDFSYPVRFRVVPWLLFIELPIVKQLCGFGFARYIPTGMATD